MPPIAALLYSSVMASLYRPFRIETLLLIAAALVAMTALYCIGYNSLSGRAEPLGEALIWPVINIIPFFLAFEAAKRGGGWGHSLAALAIALAASMLLHILAFGFPSEILFELLRRLPAMLLVAALFAGGRVVAESKVAAARAEAAELPLAPASVDWVSAAGNYVELRTPGRTIIHRATMADVHDQLGRQGFVRIHRSTLVRRDKISRVRPGDVLLDDGTSLRTGKRYRSALTLNPSLPPEESVRRR